MMSATRGLDAHVLVLNNRYRPVTITRARRAFHLLVTGAAQALDEEMRTFDFSSWSELSAELHDDVVRTPNLVLKVPRVVLLQLYDRMPFRHVRFNRQNIYFRDEFTCQYCTKRFARELLNLDHVIPRSQGGLTTWENVVCCCVPCNLRKGGRTPKQADMELLKKPHRPSWWDSFPGEFETKNGSNIPYKEWVPFLDPASASYWNTELER
jgi:5-methylcytosine-specific restriction endonuclease McrA